MTEQVTEQQPNTEQPAPAPEPQPAEQPTPEPESVKDFVSNLVNPDGTINKEAVAKAEPERAPKEEKAEPARGPDGKFVSTKEQDTEEGAADKKAGDTQDKNTEPKEGEEEAEKDGKEEPADKPTIRAPNSFNAKQREAFYALPAEQQEAVLDIVKSQQADYTRKSQELAEQRKATEAIDRALAPHRTKLAHMGVSEAQMVSQLLTLADHADRDFVGFVREQARLRGIPLETFGTQQGEGGQQADDPRIQALQSQVDQLTQLLQQDHEQRQASTLDSMAKAVEDFASDADNYPFYAELEPEMVPFVHAIRQQEPAAAPRDILAKAYKAALSLNPEISARSEADRKAREKAADLERQKQEAAKALRLGASNVSGNGVVPSGDGLSDDPANMAEFARREAARLMQA